MQSFPPHFLLDCIYYIGVHTLACAFDLYSIHSLYNIQTGEKYADATSINHSPVFPPLVSNLDCHRIEVVEKHALKHELLTTTRKKGNIYYTALVGMNESRIICGLFFISVLLVIVI